MFYDFSVKCHCSSIAVIALSIYRLCCFFYFCYFRINVDFSKLHSPCFLNNGEIVPCRLSVYKRYDSFKSLAARNVHQSIRIIIEIMIIKEKSVCLKRLVHPGGKKKKNQTFSDGGIHDEVGRKTFTLVYEIIRPF